MGRTATSHVANFKHPSNISETQRFQTEAIAAKPEEEGIEFIRSWDRLAISAISMIPLVVSLVFAGVWIGLSILKHKVDAQVAVQTGFTVAGFIVTAGKDSSLCLVTETLIASTGTLLIALFAFLDSQGQGIQ